MKLTEVLDSPEKWIQGRLFAFDEAGRSRVCLIGAVVVATGFDPNPNRTQVYIPVVEWRRYAAYLDTLGDIVGGSVAEFNDAPETTFEDVHRVCAEADRRMALHG